MFVHSTPPSNMSISLTHSQSLRFLLLYASSSDEVLYRQCIQSQSGSVCFTGKPHYPAGSQGKKTRPGLGARLPSPAGPPPPPSPPLHSSLSSSSSSFSTPGASPLLSPSRSSTTTASVTASLSSSSASSPCSSSTVVLVPPWAASAPSPSSRSARRVLNRQCMIPAWRRDRHWYVLHLQPLLRRTLY
jgi:hypothetical protein